MLRNPNNKKGIKLHNMSSFITHVYEISQGFLRHFGPTWNLFFLDLSAITDSPCNKINPVNVKRDWTKFAPLADKLSRGSKYVNRTQRENMEHWFGKYLENPLGILYIYW